MTTSKWETGTDHVVCEVAGHVATMTLNSPEKRNAIGGLRCRALGARSELERRIRACALSC